MAAGLIIFGLVTTVLFTLSYLRARRMLRKAMGSAMWVRVKGRIVESRLEFEQARGRRSAVRIYGARVTYEYAVGGTSYRSDRILFTEERSGRPQPMQRVVNQYAPGAEVDVYYDPREPQRAVLKRGVSRVRRLEVESLLGVLTGVALAALGVYLTVR